MENFLLSAFLFDFAFSLHSVVYCGLVRRLGELRHLAFVQDEMRHHSTNP
jgi:hypothetical protein